MIDRLLAIVGKELYEVRHSRLILTTMVVPTVLYVVLPIVLLRSGVLAGMGALGAGELDTLQRSNPLLRGLSPTEALQVLIIDQVMVLYMQAPLFIPLTIASYSIIGEKQVRTLEPLLATPIRTWELLVAKSAAAAIPGILVSWVSYLAFVLVARLNVSAAVLSSLVGPTWLLAFLLVVPLFALLAVGTGVIASSRTNDPRAAQQLGAVVILPIAAVLFAQVFGFIRLDVGYVLVLAAVVGLVDVGMLWLAVRLFDRESILTRWR
jgi:ABC-2 type transport system permease protein